MEKEIEMPDSFAIERLMNGESGDSWIPKAVHTVRGSDLLPGLDFVAFLESPDGVINQLRITFGIAGKLDAPRIVEEGAASGRLSILWNEVEIVDRILLSFPSLSSQASFFLNLVSAFSHLAELAEVFSDNVIEEARDE